MVRVRNLVLAIAAATALTSKAFALGLGEVKLQSSLNQPLVAEIELLDTKGLGMAEIIPGLATAEDFNKVGVDRAYFLNDLKFEPVKRPDGRPVIRVTSSQPVREPYLNFLVEVMWPNGRLLREYTLLLDPPLYSTDTVARVAPQVPVIKVNPTAPPKARPVPGPVAPVASAPATRSAPPAVEPVIAAPSTQGEADVYRVTSSDTLWEIAQRSRHGGSVHQAMLAIQELNPNAFVGGNINRMKSGQVLRLPTAEQVSSRTQAEAIAAVAEQNAAWREGRSIAAQAPATGTRQLDATRRESVSEAPAQRDQRDSLRLVAGDAGSATEGSEKGAEGEGSVAALKDRLAMSEESLDSSRRENAELKERLEDLQAQLDKLQRLMQLKDDQLAQLQQQMAEAGTDASMAQANSVKSEAPVAVAAQSESEPEEAAVVAPPVSAADTAAPAAAEPASPASEPPAPAPAPVAAPARPATPAPAALRAPEAVDEGLLGTLLANPMMLGVGGGALVLLLLALLIQSRRKAISDDEFDEEEQTVEAQASPYAQQNPLDTAEADLGGLEADEQAPVGAAATGASSDVLAEADTFIAYGRFTQAEALLQTALNQEPQRADLRLKLLEVRAEMGDAEGFARDEAELREFGGSDAEIDRLKSRYPAMAGAALAAGAAAASEFDSFAFDQPTDDQAVAGTSTDAADDFDFSLDDLETQLGGFDEPAPEKAAVEEASLESPEADGDFSLDFDLPSAEAEGTALPSEDPFADFSLDTVAEPQPTAEVESEAESALDEFSFDLDADLTSSDTEQTLEPLGLDFSLDDQVKSTSEQELPDDFDLSLESDLETGPSDDFAFQLGEMDAELEELAKRVDEPVVETEAAAAPAPAPTPALTGEMDEDFDFLAGTDETTTKLDLARAYIEMGDAEGARDILDEIMSEGNETQRQEARDMLTALS